MCWRLKGVREDQSAGGTSDYREGKTNERLSIYRANCEIVYISPDLLFIKPIDDAELEEIQNDGRAVSLRLRLQRCAGRGRRFQRS